MWNYSRTGVDIKKIVKYKLISANLCQRLTLLLKIEVGTYGPVLDTMQD